MTRRFLLALAAAFPALSAWAAAPGVAPPPQAALPLDLALRDATGQPLRLGEALDGQPAIFAFADYDCVTLCGTALGLAAATLPGTGLRPGRDYRLLVLGLDPADGPAKAAAMQRAWLGEGTALAGAARFLVGTAPALASAQAALGYSAARQGEGFLHPLALFALRPDGRLAAVLPALGAAPEELRDALREAARPEAPGLFASIRLVCQGSGSGRSAALLGVLAAAAAATVAALGGSLMLLRRRERRV
ncbi:hypothetical protein JYK14_17595 [Siccirubricoccus sp. KC 17139]|uniref:SCO family protein n=1 Tax=Siccirubricoccus soli TaxID=2899147 RepID=A0ABT1D9U4_9PROT|nr:hypothetical protein [Siccirubricoccus soli]MCO6417959.1 hypothetical protein [Siccirubricoccus soli]MCP2684094.1 hypothetical protein [Siccirubricoccus soli]